MPCVLTYDNSSSSGFFVEQLDRVSKKFRRDSSWRASITGIGGGYAYPEQEPAAAARAHALNVTKKARSKGAILARSLKCFLGARGRETSHPLLYRQKCMLLDASKANLSASSGRDSLSPDTTSIHQVSNQTYGTSYGLFQAGSVY